MKPEQQVTSLGLAIKLKELGVKQNSFFVWRHWRFNGMCIVDVKKEKYFDYPPYRKFKADTNFICSAFTVAELGEMLPAIFCISFSHANGTWTVRYEPHKSDFHCETAHTEAEARAKMLIYLLENKLINLK